MVQYMRRNAERQANMFVVSASTPAQLFHALRRQMNRPFLKCAGPSRRVSMSLISRNGCCSSTHATAKREQDRPGAGMCQLCAPSTPFSVWATGRWCC